jgi:hypothetical protein
MLAWFPVSLCFVYLLANPLVCLVSYIYSQLSRIGITRRRYRRANQKRARHWWRRALPFALIVWCRTCARSCPPRLDGSMFLSPHITKHLRWMKGRLRARSFFISRRNSQWSSGVEPFGGISSSILDGFLRSDVHFLQLPRLLSQFWSVDHEKNISLCISRVAALWGIFENRSMSGGGLDPCTLILIWDTGASFGLSPFRSDFIDYVECDIPVRDVTKVNKVIGIGTTVHRFTDTNGNPVFLPCVSYHLPQTDVRLFSPQTYHQMHGGYSEVYGQSVQMKLRTSSIHIDIIRDHANLPVVHDSYVSEKAKHGLGPIMRSGLCRARLSALDFFGEIDSSVSSIVDNAESNCFPCFPCVGDSANDNLTSPQRELLLWHWKLGINMHRVQELMRERTYEEPLGQRTVLPPIIKAKFPSARNCVMPLCQSCLLLGLGSALPMSKGVRLVPNVREHSVVTNMRLVISF